MKRNVLRVADRGWGTHRTVTAAVRAAGEGAVIHVQPGDYRESVVLDRDVTLIAEKGPGTVRIIAAHGPAITVRGGACELRDLAVEGTADRDPAVLVRGGRPVLDHCAVSGGRVDRPRNRRTAHLHRRGRRRLRRPRHRHGPRGPGGLRDPLDGRARSDAQ
ncbi:hypothetical protein QF027_000315 [Streptomyces canus]|nr:hypothetical protein [Streptomyces canus]MDQ0757680.1 hypothetical protein [Streptomyces canus]